MSIHTFVALIRGRLSWAQWNSISLIMATINVVTVLLIYDSLGFLRNCQWLAFWVLGIIGLLALLWRLFFHWWILVIMYSSSPFCYELLLLTASLLFQYLAGAGALRVRGREVIQKFKGPAILMFVFITVRFQHDAESACKDRKFVKSFLSHGLYKLDSPSLVPFHLFLHE